jgi:hypothetical protein
MPVFLRDFFFRRKPAASQGASRTVAMLPPDPELVEQSPGEAGQGAEVGVGVLRLESGLRVADGTARRGFGPRHGAVLQRFGALTMAADEGADARQEAILARLGIVHDPNEVVIRGSDRSARLVVVNRRLMSARFSEPGRVDVVFSFQKKRNARRLASDFLASLAAFCAGPVELVMTERGISGVFDVAAGLAVSDLVVGASGADEVMEPEAEYLLQAAAG